jgi:hypothetical protein
MLDQGSEWILTRALVVVAEQLTPEGRDRAAHALRELPGDEGERELFAGIAENLEQAYAESGRLRRVPMPEPGAETFDPDDWPPGTRIHYSSAHSDGTVTRCDPMWLWFVLDRDRAAGSERELNLRPRTVRKKITLLGEPA